MKIKDLLPPRPEDMHKGHRGRLLIIGGSERYPGAPALSALGALRSGAGVVTLLSLEKVCAACAARLPEVVYCYDDDKFRWKELAMAQKKIDAVVIGPGLDRSVATELVTSRMWREWEGKILVDGDGINALAAVQKDLRARNDAVITPHEGEAARLLNTTPDDVRADRFYAVSELSAKWGCAVLKGAEGNLLHAGRVVIQRDIHEVIVHQAELPYLLPLFKRDPAPLLDSFLLSCRHAVALTPRPGQRPTNTKTSS